MLVLSQPAVFTLEITSACSNLCSACSNPYAKTRDSLCLSAAVWQTWLAQFGPEAVRIRLSGGEPTLHPEFDRILTAATNYEALVSIFTNGCWPDHNKLVSLLRRHRNIAGVLVSLHGARAATHEAFTGIKGSFDETLTNVQRALDAGIVVALCMVLTRANADELEEIVDLAQRLGVQHIAFNRYVGPSQPEIELPISRMRTVILRLEEMIVAGLPVRYGECVPQCLTPNSSTGCLAGLAQVAIDPWGGIRPCIHTQMVAGSLMVQPLADVWHGAAMTRWRSALPSICADCAALEVCHGGCRAAWELTGGRADPLAGRGFPCYAFPALPSVERTLPPQGRPLLRARLRPESFGYVVLGRGTLMPVASEARALLEACDGHTTFADLEDRFGEEGSDLLFHLHAAGLFDIV